MFIVLVYRDCDVYEYRYDNLEEAEARANSVTNHPCEIVYPQNQATVS